ncbi:flagellar hook assembly protein FlgD [Colwellia sp. 4_MG-2023]|uniref:flagellar hook assembly protein FlgD n=1 Tax=unclassified Colwellia TaxID=196834 RepID=UPI0026E16E16|nr:MULTISPECIES: flagellar hook assembly protein FlgD [unclassified Colwellia]MDO6489388.1 flagellar hook assembly protein FlgD [Colwellia sp. 6_MG-2023]MDO6506978.1 flagellar hook assembly protein FlgD [Colwellia sp. 5_MG-2023]MDO6557174.1 flagellar hook assembly protein FlgD [Colwellia sp. 4_MG-2023]
METVSGTNGLDSLYWQKEEYETADSGGNGMLTQADFFALLTQELANQDPTEPADNNEMISQMTAFSTTDGVSQLNESFAGFASSMTSSQALQASSLVGRSVLVEDNVFGMSEGDSVQGKIVTTEAASNITIYVENVAGEIVQTVPVGDMAEGGAAFTWDGQTSEGEAATTGAYRFRVVGLVDGQASELQAMTYRKVDSVTLAGSNGIVLNLNGGSAMKLEDVVEVAEG